MIFRTELMGNFGNKYFSYDSDCLFVCFFQGNVGGTAGGKTKKEEGYLQ